MQLAELVHRFQIRCRHIQVVGASPHFKGDAEMEGVVVGRAAAYSPDEAIRAAILAAVTSGPVADRLASDEQAEEESRRESFAEQDPSVKRSLVARWRIVQARAGEYAAFLELAAKRAIKTNRAPAACLTDAERERLGEVAAAVGQRADDVDADLLAVVSCLKCAAVTRDAIKLAGASRSVGVVSAELDRAREAVTRLEGELATATEHAQNVLGARGSLSSERSKLSLPALLGFVQPEAVYPAAS